MCKRGSRVKYLAAMLPQTEAPSGERQPTRGSVERREIPQRGPRQSPGRKRILKYCQGHRTLLFAPMC